MPQYVHLLPSLLPWEGPLKTIFINWVSVAHYIHIQAICATRCTGFTTMNVPLDEDTYSAQN